MGQKTILVLVHFVDEFGVELKTIHELNDLTRTRPHVFYALYSLRTDRNVCPTAL
jgi:hypothetical protein